MINVQNALFKHAKEKASIRRHRSSEDILQVGTSPRNQEFLRVTPSANTNPFKHKLSVLSHKLR